MVGVRGSIPLVPTSDFIEKNRISLIGPCGGGSVRPLPGFNLYPYQCKILEPAHAPSAVISAKPIGYQSPTNRGLSSVQLLA
jgi:hypothetical protein